MSSVLSFAPLDLVDLLLNLERLEVVELWFVRLELGVELVLAGLFLWSTDDRWSEVMASTRGGLQRTISFRSNKTTRPPLSPVAR